MLEASGLTGTLAAFILKEDTMTNGKCRTKVVPLLLLALILLPSGLRAQTGLQDGSYRCAMVSNLYLSDSGKYRQGGIPERIWFLKISGETAFWINNKYRRIDHTGSSYIYQRPSDSSSRNSSWSDAPFMILITDDKGFVRVAIHMWPDAEAGGPEVNTAVHSCE